MKNLSRAVKSQFRGRSEGQQTRQERQKKKVVKTAENSLCVSRDLATNFRNLLDPKRQRQQLLLSFSNSPENRKGLLGDGVGSQVIVHAPPVLAAFPTDESKRTKKSPPPPSSVTKTSAIQFLFWCMVISDTH